MRVAPWIGCVAFAVLFVVFVILAIVNFAKVGLWWVPFALFLIAVVYFGFRVKQARWRDPRPEEVERVHEGRGLDVAELARRLDFPQRNLVSFHPTYRRTTIPKRSGGTRVLHVPERATMALQRRILHRLLRRLRAHPAACGFERGKSIVHNALPHVGQSVVIHLDVVDFFPATTAARLDAYFRRIGWDADAAALLTRFTTHQEGLPQGAPTSPRLSNLVNFGIDVRLAHIAERHRGVYTRYADDLTFSFPRDFPLRIRAFVDRTRRILKAHGYRMHQRRKLSIRRRHQRQAVTGLVVNEKVQLPRETRRWLRAVRHRVATGQGATISESQLSGWTALESMIRTQSES